MSTIIRASQQHAATQHEAFNFDDMAAQAEQYLAKVRQEAAKIVEQAKGEADAVRRRAEQEGRQAAQNSVEQMVAQQLATVLPALRQATAELGHARQAWLEHWEAAGLHVAGEIANRLIRRELETHPEIPLALVREALELAAGSPQVCVHLNPADHAAIAEQVELLTKELTPMAAAEVLPNADITRGGCRIDTQFGVIDQQFEAQLRRIEEELG
jgi:flagellar assembly protein FliH